MAGCCSGGGSGFDTASSSPFLIPGSLSLFPPTYASSPLSFFNVFGLPTAAKVTLPRDPSLSLLLLQLGSLASSFPLFSPQGGCCCSSPNKTRRVVGGGRGSAEKKPAGRNVQRKKEAEVVISGYRRSRRRCLLLPSRSDTQKKVAADDGGLMFREPLISEWAFLERGKGREEKVRFPEGREKEFVAWAHSLHFPPPKNECFSLPAKPDRGMCTKYAERC